MVTNTQDSRAKVAERTLVIDADAHVVETEHTWDFMDKADEKYRPELISPPENPNQKFWQIGGKRRGFRFNQLNAAAARERQERTGRRTDVPDSAREVDDVQVRLAVMDECGIDVQICYNTLFIEPVADEPGLDNALCRSWNRWVAEAWKKAPDRFRWSCMVPTLDMDEAIKQISFSKENGAVAASLRPVEGQRVVTDPYFDPILGAAQDLDMAMGIHIANGNAENVALWRGSLGGLGSFRTPTILACASVLQSNVHERFPRLRWGFIEASASWMPWLDAEVAQRTGNRARGETVGNIFADKNIYVTCQNEDDIPYLISRGFLDSLVIGTDFGHFDASSDVDAISKFQANTQLSPEQKEQILYQNPKALYSL